MSEKTAHEVLVEARNLIARPGGWCQNTPKTDLGFCMAGVVNVGPFADVASVERTATWDALVDAIGRPDGRHLMYWNDAPGRTQAEVVAAFDRAIQATAPEPDVGFLADVPRVEAEDADLSSAVPR